MFGTVHNADYSKLSKTLFISKAIVTSPTELSTSHPSENDLSLISTLSALHSFKGYGKREIRGVPPCHVYKYSKNKNMLSKLTTILSDNN